MHAANLWRCWRGRAPHARTLSPRPFWVRTRSVRHLGRYRANRARSLHNSHNCNANAHLHMCEVAEEACAVKGTGAASASHPKGNRAVPALLCRAQNAHMMAYRLCAADTHALLIHLPFVAGTVARVEKALLQHSMQAQLIRVRPERLLRNRTLGHVRRLGEHLADDERADGRA